MTAENDNPQEKSEEPDVLEDEEEQLLHPLSVVIDSFVHQILDIQQCAQTFIPLAWKIHNKKVDDINEKLDSSIKIVDEKEEDAEKLVGIRGIREAGREAKRLSNSDVGETLERSLYVNIFSSLDQFTGNLISVFIPEKT